MGVHKDRMHRSGHYLCLLLIGLLLVQPAWSAAEQQLVAIDTLIRMRDYATAVRRLEPLAAKGVAEAQYRLAGLYRVGKGVGKNLDRARDLYLQAAAGGHADAQFAVALLLEKSPVGTSQAEARAWYQRAAGQGHERAREKLAMMRRSAPAEKHNASRTEIFDAIRHNNVALIESLIAGGVDLNLVDTQGNSTVMAALVAGWPRLATTLIRHTQWQSRANALGDRPLHIAVARDYRDVVEALLAAGVNIDQGDAQGDTALMLAVRNQNPELIELLLERGADPARRNAKQQSAIDLAYDPDHPASKAVFASRGIVPAAVRQADAGDDMLRLAESLKKSGGRYAGWPLLNVAIELGEDRISRRLIAQRQELEATGPGGNRALHIAARKPDEQSLRKLLSQGAEVNARNRKNETPLYLAAEAGCRQCVELLLSRRADPSIVTSAGVTPLEIAVQQGNSRIASLLLSTNTAYAGIHRVLSLALEKHMQGLAKQLIPLDTELGSLDKKRRSLLWHAADNGLQDTVSRLLATRKFDINQRDANGHDALTQAVIGGHVEIARMLIDAGAQTATRTDEGNSLLMLAVSAQQLKMAAFLLTRNADINARNNSGDTALILAAANGQMRIAEMLMDGGADPKIRNNDELNAFQIAGNSGNEQIAKMIHDRSSLVFKLFN